MEPGVIAFRARSLDAAPHAHHALQVSLSRAPLTVDVRGGAIEGSAVVVAPDVTHGVIAGPCALVLIEPESRLAGHLRRATLRDRAAVALGPAAVGAGHAVLARHGMTAASVWEILSALAPEPLIGAAREAPRASFAGETAGRGGGPSVRAGGLERSAEPRVAAVLEWLDALEASGAMDQASLGRALAIARLSESRFLHLFSEHAGLPWRRYLLWRRLQACMRAAFAGSSLTRAAHAGGFSDSAHLSRTFRAMFGLTPAEIVRRSRFVQGA